MQKKTLLIVMQLPFVPVCLLDWSILTVVLSPWSLIWMEYTAGLPQGLVTIYSLDGKAEVHKKTVVKCR